MDGRVANRAGKSGAPHTCQRMQASSIRSRTNERHEASVESRTASGQLSTLELTAWRGLLRTQTWLARELDRKLLAAEGLSLSSYEVLLRLAQAEGRRMRMRDIADSLLISRSGLTGIVNELERRGYVTREHTADDGRGIEASLTKAGLAAFRKAHRVHLTGVRELFLHHLSDEQLQQLVDVWAVVGTPAGPDLASPQAR
jgi:DNA-binding MarR family transcriptional regulator